MVTIELTDRQAHDLFKYLNGLVGKGSWSTTPSWARSVMGKIQRACAEQIPSDVTKRDDCGGFWCEACEYVCPRGMV